MQVLWLLTKTAEQSFQSPNPIWMISTDKAFWMLEIHFVLKQTVKKSHNDIHLAGILAVYFHVREYHVYGFMLCGRCLCSIKVNPFFLQETFHTKDCLFLFNGLVSIEFCTIMPSRSDRVIAFPFLLLSTNHSCS